MDTYSISSTKLFYRNVSEEDQWKSLILTAYRYLETDAADTGAGMLLIHLKPHFSVMQDVLRYGRAKMTC